MPPHTYGQNYPLIYDIVVVMQCASEVMLYLYRDARIWLKDTLLRNVSNPGTDGMIEFHIDKTIPSTLKSSKNYIKPPTLK